MGCAAFGAASPSLFDDVQYSLMVAQAMSAQGTALELPAEVATGPHECTHPHKQVRITHAHTNTNSERVEPQTHMHGQLNCA